MPTLQSIGSTRIKIYADDHNPPHFHITGPDFQVMVRISDLSIIAGNASSAQLLEAMTWAKAHRDILALMWIELNERI